MDSFSVDVQPGVESSLIDLDAVSMAALRELDGAMFEQSLWHVIQQNTHPQVTASGDNSARID